MALRLKLKGCQGPDVVRAVSITLVLPVVLEYPTTRVNSYTCRDLAPEGGGGGGETLGQLVAQEEFAPLS